MTTERSPALAETAPDPAIGGSAAASTPLRSAPDPEPQAGPERALQQAVIRQQAGLLARQECALAHQACLLAHQERVLAATGTGLWSCRLADGALEWSGGVHDLFGIPRGSALHRARILDFYEPASRRLLETIRQRAITGHASFRLDAEIRTAGGRPRWIRIRASVETEGGRAARLFGTKQDVTEEIARLSELSRRADRDPLTGLANRRAFEAQFDAGTAGSGPDPLGALILIDLDGFKPVNDVYGHAAGDLCIRRSAARLAAVCGDAALVARIGGDEFAVLVRAPADPCALAEHGRRIVAALNRPIPYRGHVLRIGASVGIATGSGSRTRLFGRADAALYAAKAAGGNAVRLAAGGGRSAAGAAQATVTLGAG